MRNGERNAIEARSHVERLRAARCFSTLSGDDAARLVKEAHERRLDEGDRLWRTGAPAAGFAIVEDGLVLISAPRRDGERAVLGLFGPGECVGLSAALGATPYPADAIAFTKTVTVLWVPAPALRRLASVNPGIAAAVQRGLLDHTAALRAKIEILSAGKVPARIGSLLLHLAERFGAPDAHGAPRVALPVSRVALAQLVSARTETVIRILSRWKRERVIIADEGGFTLLDLEALREARGELARMPSRPSKSRSARD